MCSFPPFCTSRSMVVEEASILSPVHTERTMASDSPARSLDEIDLSALRVNVSLSVHVRAVSVSRCARAREAVEHLSPPPSVFPSSSSPAPSSPPHKDASPSCTFIWFCCCPPGSLRARACMITRVLVCVCARALELVLGGQ